MLMLLFYIGENLHAIDADLVVEVIPKVCYRNAPHLPDYVAGLFNYRGTIVPAIDMCHLINGDPSADNLSTRVMIVSYQQGGQFKYMALIAERVTKTLTKFREELIESSMKNENSPYLNKIIMHDRSIIQYIDLQELLRKFEDIKLLDLGDKPDVYIYN
jgi:chemotaxis-related protein WspB